MTNARTRIIMISLLCVTAVCGVHLYVSSPILIPQPAGAAEMQGEIAGEVPAAESSGEVTERGTVRDHRGMVPTSPTTPPPAAPPKSVAPSTAAPAPPVVSGGIATGPYTPGDNIGWPQFMSNSNHTGSRMVLRGMPEWHLLWYTPFGRHPILLDQSPVVHPETGTIYVGSMDRTTNRALVAVNPEGTIRWTTGLRPVGNEPEPVGGNYRVRGSPAITTDSSGYSLVVPAQLQYFENSAQPVWRSVSRLFHVSPTNGQVLRNTDPLFGDVSSPVHILGNQIFVGASLWKRKLGGRDVPTANPHLFRLDSNFRLVEHAAYSAGEVVGDGLSWCDVLFCFDTSGIPVPPSPNVEPLYFPPSTPSYGGQITGQIIVSGNGTYSVSASQPYTYRWKKALTSAISPTILGGLTSVVKDGTVTNYNAASGEKNWSYRIGRSPVGIASYALGSEIVYFVAAEDGDVYAIKDGQLLWRRNVGKSCSAANPISACITAPSLIHGGTSFPTWVIVASGDGFLYALDKNDGRVVLSPLQLGGQPTRGAPAIVEGRIYVAMRDGLVAVGSVFRPHVPSGTASGTPPSIQLRGLEGGQPAEPSPGISSPAEQSGEKKREQGS